MSSKSSGTSGGGNGNLLGNSGGTNTFTPGQNFWEFNPRNIAGLNANLRAAGSGAQGLFGAGSGALNAAGGMFQRLGSGGSGYLDQAMGMASKYGGGNLPAQFKDAQRLTDQLRGVSRQQVTGANLGSDPALRASRKNFALSTLPNIQNQAAAMGLGRSNTANNAMGMAAAAADVPMINAALAREEAGLGRQMSALNSSIQQRMGAGGSALGANDAATRSLLGGAGQEASQLAAAGQGAAGIGSQQFQQQLGAVQSNAAIGSGMRDIRQEMLDAPYEEQQRLYAEALNSMYGPLGMLGSLIGGTSTTSKK